ncbi:MAG: PAS domain-containing protein [Halocynthiibacter sp.]
MFEGKSADAQNLVSLARFQNGMDYRVLRQLEGYWDGLRAGRTVPRRSEVDPRGIEDALEYAFILERIAPGLARFRLAGMHLVDLMGMEVRGMPLTAFFTPEFRRPVSDILEQVFDGPQTAEMTLSGEKGIGKPALEAKLLMLPLKSDLGDVSRVLGCLVSKGRVGRSPRRFNLENSHSNQIDNITDAPQQARQQTTEGFAEQGKSFVPERTPKRTDGQRPILRLVKSDD